MQILQPYMTPVMMEAWSFSHWWAEAAQWPSLQVGVETVMANFRLVVKQCVYV